MATITTFTQTNPTGRTIEFVSGEATILSNDKVLLTDLPSYFRHCTVAVRMYDATGARVVGTAGTFTVDYLAKGTGISTVAATFEDPTAAVITAATPTTITWDTHTTGVQIIEAGVLTAITWDAVITFNEV